MFMSHDSYKANTYSKFTKHGDKGIRASYHKKKKKSSVHKGMQPEGKKRIKELQNNRKTIRGL